MEEVIEKLEAARKVELLSVTKLLAELVFTGLEDQEWIERIFAMHNDIFAQTPTYQKLVKQGREEGIEALRQTLVDVVQEHFPEIAVFAQKQVEGMEDLTFLRQLIVKMSTARTIQEAIQLLITAESNTKKE
jgi:rubrerythrin